MGEWKAGAFNTRCMKRESGEAHDVAVAGWINGPFAIDFRAFVENADTWGTWEYPRQGWCITHIPSGMAVQKVIGNLEVAKGVADHILALGDWVSITPETSSEQFGEQMRQIRKALGDANGTSVSCVGAVS